MLIGFHYLKILGLKKVLHKQHRVSFGVSALIQQTFATQEGQVMRWPLWALILFVVAFAIQFILILKKSKKDMQHLAQIPLQEDKRTQL